MSDVLTRQRVIVVGAGPVGLATAIELGTRGIDVEVLDASDGTVPFPAGEAIFSRTMEHLRRWGVADDARRRSEPPLDYPHRIVFMTSVTGHLLTSFDNGATNRQAGEFAAFTAEGPAFISKFAFLPLLQEMATAQQSVKIAHRQVVVGLDQDEEGVDVLVKDTETGATRSMRAAYVVACDGGRSWVRKQLGIELVGHFAQGRNFAVHFRAPALMGLLREHALGPAAQIQTLAADNRPYITVVNGEDEWRLSVYVDDDPDPGDAERWVRAAVGADIDVEILRAQPWSGHRVVADRYRDRRIFLAGDAAHLLWPKGGFGANTGIGDAVDLGWKLAAVIAGWGGNRLLDSYEAERRPIAVRNVSEASTNRDFDARIVPDPALDLDNPVGEKARKNMGELIQAVRGREFRSIGVQLGYRYDDSPVIIRDDSPQPPDEPDAYVPSTWSGSRAPHVWLPDGRSTLDRFGTGFVLIDTSGGPESAMDRIVEAAAVRQVPFEALQLNTAEVRRVYGSEYVLVRPDGHVCWRGTTIRSDPGQLLDAVRGV